MARLDVDDVIVRILQVGTPGQGLVNMVKEPELQQLCAATKNQIVLEKCWEETLVLQYSNPSSSLFCWQVFMSRPTMVEFETQVKICEDPHGQFGDVLRLFDLGGFPPLVNYLFLGDYVYRGHQNLEVIFLLLSYKIGLNSPITSSFFAGITNVLPLTVSTFFMRNATADMELDCGKCSRIASRLCFTVASWVVDSMYAWWYLPQNELSRTASLAVPSSGTRKSIAPSGPALG